jgi:uncharacterized protein (TIGR03435 family)
MDLFGNWHRKLQFNAVNTKMGIGFLTLAALAVSATAAPTQAGDGVPRFEVASVKTTVARTDGMGGNESIVAHPGSLTMRRVRLRACIRWAYDLKEYQVAGLNWMGSPGWLGGDVARYEIEAKAAAGTTVAELRLMLRTLLAERFAVRVHRETREVPAYLLTVYKQGPDLKASEDSTGEGTPGVRGGVLSLTKTSMAEFAEWLSGPMGAPVVDATKLQGRFDLSINEAPYLPASGATREDSQYAFVKAIQEQLGLKLEKRSTPIEMLIVDSAEKTPTGN